ncbi:carbohydrate kinase family protein [Abyssalbus ytuae]|uniref:Carbohydrate kinase n=1 Tax=Abyssalbus ytuae TaxID=2926907 RepID=A0A9E7CU16_9FLAO|nr:carbohydrate kinase [Abyssalbus ytuae]UOB19211.1 carbohydrate kinase [Abyssalbus ytuae]
MINVFCIGEILIDFVAEKQGNDLSKADNFIKKAGGAPANVAAAISKLKGKSYFVGAVGKDPFGLFLKNTLKNLNVLTTHLQEKEIFTTLAFVSIAENGERDFVFSRGADAFLDYDPNFKTKLKESLVHFGSATAFLEGNLESTYSLYLNEAVTNDCFISFDPNFRTDLWKNNEQDFIKKSIAFIEKADFSKFSIEEAQLISGETDIEKACDKLHKYGTKIIAVTLGSEGTYLSTLSHKEIIKSIKVNPIDTTGAGDAFVGCFLKLVADLKNPKVDLEDFILLKKMIKTANVAGALTTTNYGAIASLPTMETIKRYE